MTTWYRIGSAGGVCWLRKRVGVEGLEKDAEVFLASAGGFEDAFAEESPGVLTPQSVLRESVAGADADDGPSFAGP
jgi:hypothetical protein